jgi:tetratricopeptide (TPR) repeat protein
MASLEEAGPELAVAFWRVLRKVRAWAETPPEGRAGLFAINKKEACERLGAACGLAPALVEAFGTFSVLVRAPGRVDARQLAEACHQVHEWAEERSLIEVAMLFAEAAAFADPDDPAWANDAGRMCRRAAKDERAASWYHRGYGLGARFDTQEEVIRAQIGYGNLMKDLGQHDEARKFLERAARRAIYTGRKRQAGEAHHDLLAIAAEVGTYAEAERHVRRALNLYPLQHPRLPYLIHDFTFVLIRNHYFTHALSVSNHLLGAISKPQDLILVYGTVARAAGGARQRHQFEQAEKKVLDLLAHYEEYAAAALIHLAEGAQTFGEEVKSGEYASLALSIAQKRKESLLVRDSLALLDRVTAGQVVPCEDLSASHGRFEQLMHRFESRLRKWKAPGHDSPGAQS